MPLDNRLRDAMQIMEKAFAEFDADRSGVIKFEELAKKLSMRGFHDGQKLQELFNKVDRNHTGKVGFAEFLMLMYLWNDVGPQAYQIMFCDANSAEIVNKGFSLMEKCYICYDADKTRVLKHDEFHRFMTEQLNAVYQSPGCIDVINKYFPPSKNFLRFHEFLYVMYRILIPSTDVPPQQQQQQQQLMYGQPPQAAHLPPGAQQPPQQQQGGGGGMYGYPQQQPGPMPHPQQQQPQPAPHQYMAPPSPAAQNAGGLSPGGMAGSGPPAWNMIAHAFSAMERDFGRFDRSNSGCIDLKELTEGLSASRCSNELVEVLGRLEYYFQQVDLDGSGTLSFFEFMYLMYLMVQTGAYKDIIQDASDAATVKKCLLFLEQSYIKYDTRKTKRLNIDDLHAFLRENFGVIPVTTDEIFKRLRTSEERPHIDLCRFMRLLYELIFPQGRYIANPARRQQPVEQMLQTYIGAPPGKHVGRLRVENLDPREVAKDKQIGQGGFGAVYSATFRGQIVAAKYLLESASPELCNETEKEVNVMKMFDHPNIVFLVGACTRMPEVCIVTEYCKNGSLFDCMHKKRINFDLPSMWRIVKECAEGLSELHKHNVVHRDVKSLNVLLDEHFTVKICDFGLSKIMTKNSMMMTKGLGTPHWMAPEVISSSHYGPPSDVYSYGIVLWEIFHRQIPYGNMDATQITMGVHSKGMRPPISSRCHPTMSKFMQWCWQQDPNQRPNFTMVIEALNKVQSEFVR